MQSLIPKSFVFVLMPFSPKFDDVYNIGIKDACEACGVDCERVDQQIFDGLILNKICSEISRADIIISEMTGNNSNVFWETGYAHALGKRMILLTQNAKDIPFNLNHFQHIIYHGKINYLRAQLEKTINWMLRHPEEILQPHHHGFFVEGRSLEAISEARRKALVGEWQGYAHQETGPDSIPLDTKISGELKVKGRKVEGEFLYIYKVKNEDIEFRANVIGGFLYDKFLQLQYINQDERFMQFGSALFALSGDATELKGWFVGHGAHSERVVHGSMTVKKKS